MARRDAGNVVQGERRPAVAGRATVMSRPHSAFINEIRKPKGKRESSHQLSHGCRGVQLRLTASAVIGAPNR
jgi:hypothetical protein